MDHLTAFQVYPLWEYLGGLEKDWVLFWGLLHWFYVLSPWILLANCMSLGIIVIHLTWIAHKFVSSNSPMRYTSHTSCSPIMAVAWICNSLLFCLKISYTSLWNGCLHINNSVLFWYHHISLSATVPGLHLLFLWVKGFIAGFCRAFWQFQALQP